MTARHEQLYRRTLHRLASHHLPFCVIGSFALYLHDPALPRRLVHDCDLLLPDDPALLNAVAGHLQHAGWQLTLWEVPCRLPLTAAELAGKYYLRARLHTAVLDCSYANVQLSWAACLRHTQQQQGLPVLAPAEVLRAKMALNRPQDQRILQFYQLAS